MEELIKEAERLYNFIDKIQVDLINSRLVGNEEKKQSSINHMETLMYSTLKFLKCIIERKDNIKIIKFRNLWDEQPEKNRTVLVFPKDGQPIIYKKLIEKNFRGNPIVVWCYLDEILPKGGEVWNTTK